MGIKDIALLVVRVYCAYTLFMGAGRTKLGAGSPVEAIDGLASTIIPMLGSPFTLAPKFFASGLLFAEVVCPALLLVGFRSKLAGLTIAFSMAVASYLHLVVFKQGFDSIVYPGQPESFHGAGVFLLMGAIIAILGGGKLSLDGVLRPSKKAAKNE
jgi:uncharacterized membrane protein YphA (DoxX/SURF4 family)